MLHRKMSTYLTQNSIITLLDIEPKDASPYHRDNLSTMIVAALFIISRNWKQPKCTSIDDCTKSGTLQLSLFLGPLETSFPDIWGFFSHSDLFILFYSIFLFYYQLIEALSFLVRNRKIVDPYERGGGKELGGIEGGEFIIRIYYVREKVK